ncbi:sensor histidine kinase [Parafrigoribacterium soli]|uniref:sensor histidine kinase n=1 Tax=Parafrigoribacterium soli TaxID=3144663 RepID=UPI0032EAED24
MRFPADPHDGGRWSRFDHDPWIEHYLARRQSASRFPPVARLWMPVIVSFLVQVPAVFFVWHPAVRHLVLARPGGGELLLALLVALVGPLALIGARRFPGPVVAIVTVAASADLLLHRGVDGPPYIALAFAIVSAIVRGARIWAWISVTVAGVTALLLGFVFSAGWHPFGLGRGLAWQPIRMVGITLGLLLVMGIGEAVRTRRERHEEFSRRLAQRKQTEVQAERVRIARELHDVLAHSLSQINVQAAVGLHLMNQHPEKAAEALASIKESSKTALDEVRSVLGVLRAEGGADPSAPLVPEPDLSRLAGLAASVTAQGTHVEVRNELAIEPPAAVQLALYRIAQESLTNVLRHSGATSVTLTLREIDGFFELSVLDNGTGQAPTKHEQDSGGRGLLGMRERAQLLGGTLDAGTAEAGGFRVVARIPIPRKGSLE